MTNTDYTGVTYESVARKLKTIARDGLPDGQTWLSPCESAWDLNEAECFVLAAAISSYREAISKMVVGGGLPRSGPARPGAGFACVMDSDTVGPSIVPQAGLPDEDEDVEFAAKLDQTYALAVCRAFAECEAVTGDSTRPEWLRGQVYFEEFREHV